MNTQVLKTAIIMATIGLASSQAFAANQGAIDSVASTGDFLLTVTKGDAVSINSIDDMTVQAVNGADSVQTSTACLFASTALYDIEINTNNNFLATHTTDPTKTMAYTVDWDDGSNPVVQFSANTDTSLGSVPSTNNIDVTCGGADNTTITVTIPKAEIAGNPTGSFTDTVTLIVTAN